MKTGTAERHAAGILFALPPLISAGRCAADPNHPARRRRQNIIGAGSAEPLHSTLDCRKGRVWSIWR